jgi:hypothetical protein
VHIAPFKEKHVQQSPKQFSDELNKSLDDIGAPIAIRDRAVVLSKMLNIPKQQAWGLLEGHLSPDDELLKQIATELEINVTPFLKNDKSK